MSTGTIIVLVVGVVVLLAFAALLVWQASGRREERDRERAADLRQEAESHEIQAQQTQAAADQRAAQAEQQAAAARRQQMEAEEQARQAGQMRDQAREHALHADEVDPDVDDSDGAPRRRIEEVRNEQAEEEPAGAERPRGVRSPDRF